MTMTETETQEPMVRVVSVRCQKCGTEWHPKISGGRREYGFVDNAPPVYPRSFLRQRFLHETTDSMNRNLARDEGRWRPEHGCGGQIQMELEAVR